MTLQGIELQWLEDYASSMKNRIAVFFSVLAAGLLTGCASVTMVTPTDGQTGIVVPVFVSLTTQGTAQLGDVYLDSNDVSRLDNRNWQFAPQFWLSYVGPGAHSVYVAAENIKTHQSIGPTAHITVSDCPLCYVCPVGEIHPINGQCCQNGVCDIDTAANSGVGRIEYFQTSQKCKQAVAPGSSEFLFQRGCIASDTVPIAGAGTTKPQMVAVKFTANVAGALTQIRVPVDIISGQPTLTLWVTADAGGAPGAVIETITQNNVRARNLPVRNPINVFSGTKPALTGGTNYWLVIGAGSATTSAEWNKGLEDASIPSNTTLLINTTSSSPAGPWTPKSNLVEIVPAFEISVH
jgi:hypothetical protein